MEGAGPGGAARTHTSSQLASAVGSAAAVAGWVVASRGHGGVSFVTLRDLEGDVQVVAKRGQCPDADFEAASRARPHSSVSASGTVRASERAPGGAELAMDSMRTLSEAAGTPPFEPQAREVRNIETRLDARAVDLRRRRVSDVFRARAAAVRAARGYLDGEGFAEVSTPKIISSAAEGGASMFSVFYYSKEAYLAQSPQIYKEQLTMSLERVYEVGPIFRAESSRTGRHLSEATSLDIEAAFEGYEETMGRAAEVVRRAAGAARGAPDVPAEIPRYTYAEVLERAREGGAPAEWGSDLYPQSLRAAGMEGFYFVKDWPLGPKPFYVKPKGDGLSESFDLMFGDLEVASGGTRLSSGDELRARLEEKGMRVDTFESHLRAFEYGMPPHAGCGIGVERLMMALAGLGNIRDAALYPRDPDRLVP